MWPFYKQQRIQQEERTLQEEGGQRGLIDLVDLVPFDVQIALTENVGIQSFEVTDIVTDWLNASFERQLVGEWTEYAAFDTVILLDAGQGRRLQEQQQQPGVLYTARFEGAALFTRTQDRSLPVPVSHVLEMQRNTLSNEDPLLLQALVDAEEATGLGSRVAAVNAYLNPLSRQNVASSGNSGKNDQLQVVIVVAVCIAFCAFLCLVAAIVWAWRYDRRNRAAYLVGKQPTTEDTTSQEDDPAMTAQSTPSPKKLPEEVYGNTYAESCLSEDISTALSQYYRSGLGQRSRAAMNDGASVSSMESYGYSLDGYAPTIGSSMPEMNMMRPDDEEDDDDVLPKA